MQTSVTGALLEPDLRTRTPWATFSSTALRKTPYKQNVAYALQSDAAYKLNDSHTLRAGVFLQSDHSTSRTDFGSHRPG